MTDRANGEFSLPDLWMTLQEFEDGALDAARREALMAELQESLEARRAYFEYFQQSATFKLEGAKMHEQGLLPVAGRPMTPSRLFQRSILAAAALIAVLGIVAALVAVRQPEPGVLAAVVAADTRWMVDGVPQDRKAKDLAVVEGSTVQVISGTVELDLESGVRMVLQGPARADFADLRRPVLKEGWLWIDSGASDEPFAVSARGLVIRDIGTRFGVRVPHEGPIEVHLLEGKVEVSKAEAKTPFVSLLPTGSGKVVRPGGPLEEIELAPDPFPGLPALLAAEPNFRTTVMSQAAVGYWCLNEEGGREFANELSEQTPAQSGVEVIAGDPGPGPDDGFAGFPGDNRALRFTGDPDKSALVEIGGARGVSRREGAAAFWIRRDPDTLRREVLWLAGETTTGRDAPEVSLLATEITESGHVRFAIENGKFDVVLSSSRRVTDGEWHYIVVSWGPSAVELFIDGKLAARDADSRVLKEGTFSGRYVRFGKPGSDLRSEGAASFSGWVDEIVLWNRPLTYAEVRQQIESARGGGR